MIDNSIINENLNVAVVEGDDGVRVRWNKEEERNVLSLLKDEKCETVQRLDDKLTNLLDLTEVGQN